MLYSARQGGQKHVGYSWFSPGTPLEHPHLQCILFTFTRRLALTLSSLLSASPSASATRYSTTEHPRICCWDIRRKASSGHHLNRAPFAKGLIPVSSPPSGSLLYYRPPEKQCDITSEKANTRTRPPQQLRVAKGTIVQLQLHNNYPRTENCNYII